MVADGPPERVFADARRRRSPLRGVWVPGPHPRRGAAPDAAGTFRWHPAGRAGGQRGWGACCSRAGSPSTGAPGARAGCRRCVADVDLAVRCLAPPACVLGDNGSGKSTLALALAGLSRPAAGRVVAATPALAAGLHENRPHRWRARDLVTRIGTVFQEPEHQFVAPTVADELAVGPRRAGVRSARWTRRVEELLARLRLEHARPGQPVHAVRRRAAPAVGRGACSRPAPGPRARRADVRAGRAHLGRARRPAAGAGRRRRRRGRRDARRRAGRRPGARVHASARSPFPPLVPLAPNAGRRRHDGGAA